MPARGRCAGRMYQDKQFAALFPRRGQPAEAPGRLALVTVLQFMEALSDRQAADAVRARIDWKYALGLELTDSGFDHTVLSEFRTRLVEGKLELLLLDTLLESAQTLGLLKQRGRQRTDSTHVLASVRTMNRLERVGETLRAALNALAAADPEWLTAIADPEWFKRYGRRIETFPRLKLRVTNWRKSWAWTARDFCMRSRFQQRGYSWKGWMRSLFYNAGGKSNSSQTTKGNCDFAM
jgi:transposase